MTQSNPGTQQPVMTVAGCQTVQREHIANTLEQARGPLTAVQIFEITRREVPDVGISTVYRALKMLQEANLVRLVILPDGVARYEKAGRAPHHFHCRTCGGIWTIQSAALNCIQGESLVSEFLTEDHESTFHGQCANCNSSLSNSLTRCK